MITLSEFAKKTSYYEINREERNVAAILYHFLLKEENLDLFIKKINSNLIEDKKEQYAVYFEYAFLRDLWDSIEKLKNGDKPLSLEGRNNIKKESILSTLKTLQIQQIDKIENTDSIAAFNSLFFSKGKSSTKQIVSPSNWNVSTIYENFKSNSDDFRTICMYKWCFNAKPDIVIHTSNVSAICIEAKWVSSEGSYPTSKLEKTLFDECFKSDVSNPKKNRVGQLEIQRMLMTQILGIDHVEFAYLTRSGKEQKEITELSWADIFESYDDTNTILSTQLWIKRIINECRSK
jgi:hypothetical protein